MGAVSNRASESIQPTASIRVLRHRARLLKVMRDFFDHEGFFEVETPILSIDTVVDAWLEPFVADWIPLGCNWRTDGSARYLQTSPEFAMKRLMAAGAGAIYQLGKVFRNGESGQRHNPEFTMLEWYRQGDDLQALMSTTEQLVQRVISATTALPGFTPTADSSALYDRVMDPRGFEQVTYREAFIRRLGTEVLSCSMDEIWGIASTNQLVPPPGLDLDDRDGWLNFLLAELIEPELGRGRPTFLVDYPASQAALARLSHDGLTAHRFELYLDGIELCNGYDELTDATTLRDRIREQTRIREAVGLRPLPQQSRLLTVMEKGLPPCSGNALGVDRLIMLALGLKTISEVIPFPFEIA
ncbi:EF-P lysine aminoacylase EpmA [Schlesneria sp. T3-172]|uniref:EF-P lysine aminoacylase EpmA n=1 Tax=Schlesneria sphaerica TaxID=3373610 RepID=UPI0037C62EFC